ncbi:hypothetical protein [Nocardioides insulae]|uniref:hypothetical protein n=1 Tax=Nocardioides insulae TaxID=394734 RepID=UPI00040F9401|nr:hypothetical protein [Nocardioides insulae]
MPPADVPDPGTQPGLNLGPIRPPSNPLDRPHPHAAMFAELMEQTARRLESAVAADAEARADAESRPQSAQGEGLEGEIKVRVNGKGMLESAEFGPECAYLSRDQLREETMTAINAARDELGGGRSISPEDTAKLFERPMAAAVMRLLGEEK